MRKKTKPPISTIPIKYESSRIEYVREFAIHPTAEEVVLDLSSGIEFEKETPVLAVNSRVAMNWKSIEKLAEQLNKMIANRNQQLSGKQNHYREIPHANLPRATVNNPTTPV